MFVCMDVDVETAYATMLLCSFIESSSHLCLYHRILHAGDHCTWERCNKRLCIGTVLVWYACYMLLFELWIVTLLMKEFPFVSKPYIGP